MSKPATSNEGTKYMLGVVEAALPSQEAHLAWLLACTELTVQVPYFEKVNGRREEQSHTVVLKESDMYTTDYDSGSFPATAYELPDGTKGWKVFADERASQVAQIERRIKGIKDDIAFLKQKIAEWKP